MDQWKNRVAVVTRASSGIGAAIAKDLAMAGMITIGLARRVHLIECFKEDLPLDVRGNLHAIKCDVTKVNEIIRVFSEIHTKFNGIDVLINNAGILRETEFNSDNSVAIREVIETNLFGQIFCAREAFKSMKRHKRNSYIVHLNSSHQVQMLSPNSSKYGAAAAAEIHRHEIMRCNLPIKVTSVSPGGVKTAIVGSEMMEKFDDIPLIQPEDISQSVLWAVK